MNNYSLFPLFFFVFFSVVALGQVEVLSDGQTVLHKLVIDNSVQSIIGVKSDGLLMKVSKSSLTSGIVHDINHLTDGRSDKLTYVFLGEGAGGNNTGQKNVGVGIGALGQNTNTVRNSAFGYLSLFTNKGSYNSAFGHAALHHNDTGDRNAGFGDGSLAFNTSGQSNTAMGFHSQGKNKTGSHNVAVGMEALFFNIQGSGNVGLGYKAGSLILGANNIAIGNEVQVINSNGSNQINIGNAIYKTSSNRIGIFTSNPITNFHVNGNIHASGAYWDSSANPGSVGQVLSSTGSGTDWVDASSLSTVSHTGQIGSIFFAGSNGGEPSEDNSQLFWDNTNNWLGIGTSSPSVKLHVNGHVRAWYFRSGNGTPVKPTFCFNNDLNTGMFRAGSDRLGFSTAGYERVRIDNHGNVGIGTLVPSNKLEVVGDVSVTGSYKDSNGDAGTTGQVLSSTSAGTDWVDADFLGVSTHTGPAGAIFFADGNNGEPTFDVQNFFWNKNDNRLGIGTNTPSYAIDIAAFSDDDQIRLFSSEGVLTLGYGLENGNSTIRGENLDEGASWAIGFDEQFPNFLASAAFGTTSDTDVSFYTNSTVENIRLKPSGRVGIGTTSPAHVLDIATGTASTHVKTFKYGFETAFLGNGGWRRGFRITGETEGKSTVFAGSTGGDAYIATGYSIANDELGVNSKVITFKSNKNVGIGTTVPSEKLEVSGNIKVTGSYKDSNGDAGTIGQVLSSTVSGTDWVDASSGSGSSQWKLTNTTVSPINNSTPVAIGRDEVFAGYILHVDGKTRIGNGNGTGYQLEIAGHVNGFGNGDFSKRVKSTRFVFENSNSSSVASALNKTLLTQSGENRIKWKDGQGDVKTLAYLEDISGGTIGSGTAFDYGMWYGSAGVNPSNYDDGQVFYVEDGAAYGITATAAGGYQFRHHGSNVASIDLTAGQVLTCVKDETNQLFRVINLY